MPVPALRSVARKAGTSTAKAEALWRRLRKKTRPQAGREKGKRSYRYLMGAVKRALGKR